jgi:hypothetical protein
MMIRTAFGNINSKAKCLGLLTNSVRGATFNMQLMFNFKDKHKVFQTFNANLNGPFTCSSRFTSVWSTRLSLNCAQMRNGHQISRQLSTHVLKCSPKAEAEICLGGPRQLSKAKYLCSLRSLQPVQSFSTSCASLAVKKKKKKKEIELLPFEVDTNNITQDLLVYSNEGQNRFFFIVSLFGVIQMGFWVYLAYFSYNTLRDTPEKDDMVEKKVVDADAVPFWRKVNLGGNKYRFGIALLCAAVGKNHFFIDPDLFLTR